MPPSTTPFNEVSHVATLTEIRSFGSCQQNPDVALARLVHGLAKPFGKRHRNEISRRVAKDNVTDRPCALEPDHLHG